MRCSGWSSLAISVYSALVFVGSAGAHVVATPTFLESGGSESIAFSAPNERDVAMTALSITVPPGIEIESAHDVEGWSESVDGPVATWRGGLLAPNEEGSFELTLEARAEPGFVELLARQRYGDSGVVRWSVPLTVTPPAETPAQNLGWALVIALVGLFVVAVLGVAIMRRARSLQEK